MKVIWWIKDKGVLNLKEFTVIEVLPFHIKYKKGRIIKRIATVRSKVPIDEYYYDSNDINLLQMEQVDDELIPVPLKGQTKEDVQTYSSLLEAEKMIHNRQMESLRTVVENFINIYLERDEKNITYFTNFFARYQNMGNFVGIVIEKVQSFLESFIGQQISQIDVQAMMESMRDQLLKEMSTVYQESDIYTKPLLSALYTKKLPDKSFILPEGRHVAKKYEKPQKENKQVTKKQKGQTNKQRTVEKKGELGTPENPIKVTKIPEDEREDFLRTLKVVDLDDKDHETDLVEFTSKDDDIESENE